MSPQPSQGISDLPDTFRAALLTYFRPSTALLMELIAAGARTGQLDPRAFTVSDVLRINDSSAFGIAEGTLRRAVSEGVDVFFSKVETEKDSPSVLRIEKKGRRADVFALLPFEEMRRAVLAWAAPRIYEAEHQRLVAKPLPKMLEALDLPPDEAAEVADELDALFAPIYAMQGEENAAALHRARRRLARLQRSLNLLHSTPLPEGWPLNTAANYRAALLHAQHQEQPDERRSRRDLRERVGVSDSHLKRTLERAGLTQARKGGEFELRPVRSAANLEASVRQMAGQVKGYPRALVIQSGQGKARQEVRVPYQGAESRAVVEAHLKAGAAVYVQFQTANHFIISREGPPPPEDRERRAAERPAEPAAPKQPKFYGPAFNPLWVLHQLKLALLLLQPERWRVLADEEDDGAADARTPFSDLAAERDIRLPISLLDLTTGERIDHPTGRDLLGLLLGRAFDEKAARDDVGMAALLMEGLALGGVLARG